MGKNKKNKKRNNPNPNVDKPQKNVNTASVSQTIEPKHKENANIQNTQTNNISSINVKDTSSISRTSSNKIEKHETSQRNQNNEDEKEYLSDEEEKLSEPEREEYDIKDSNEFSESKKLKKASVNECETNTNKVKHTKESSDNEKHETSKRNKNNEYKKEKFSEPERKKCETMDSKSCKTKNCEYSTNKDNTKKSKTDQDHKSENWRERNNNESQKLRKNYEDYSMTEFANTSKSGHKSHFETKPNNHLQSKYSDYQTFMKTYVENSKDIDFRKVKEEFGDLFTADKEYSLGHCVAEDMAMGSGIAVGFRQRFKRVDELLNQRKTQGEVAILQDKQRYIYYLVTKRISSGKPTYDTLLSSLNDMRKHIVSYDVKKLALPRIGCGLDRLEWKTVKKMLEYIFQHVDIEIVIYDFQQDSDAIPPSKLRNCKVVNVDYPISKIEYGTIIIYFGSEDGYPTEELKAIGERFPFVVNRYKLEEKEMGKNIFVDRYSDGYAFYGCIVRKDHRDHIDFVCLQKCLGSIQSRNRKEKYSYIAFQAFAEDRNDLTVSKILNLMRYSMTDVEIYVCWPENLQYLKSPNFN